MISSPPITHGSGPLPVFGTDVPVLLDAVEADVVLDAVALLEELVVPVVAAVCVPSSVIAKILATPVLFRPVGAAPGSLKEIDVRVLLAVAAAESA